MTAQKSAKTVKATYVIFNFVMNSAGHTRTHDSCSISPLRWNEICHPTGDPATIIIIIWGLAGWSTVFTKWSSTTSGCGTSVDTFSYSASTTASTSLIFCAQAVFFVKLIKDLLSDVRLRSLSPVSGFSQCYVNFERHQKLSGWHTRVVNLQFFGGCSS